MAQLKTTRQRKKALTATGTWKKYTQILAVAVHILSGCSLELLWSLILWCKGHLMTLLDQLIIKVLSFLLQEGPKSNFISVNRTATPFSATKMTPPTTDTQVKIELKWAFENIMNTLSVVIFFTSKFCYFAF